MALVMLPLVLPGVGMSDTPSDDSMPGLGSFVVFAFMAVALYFLLKNMNARLRRMSYREKEREAAEQEAREAEGPTEAEGPIVPDLSPSDEPRETRSGGGAASGGSEPPHTDSSDPTHEPPSGERGGRTT